LLVVTMILNNPILTIESLPVTRDMFTKLRGYNFITLCWHKKVCRLGEIIDGKMVLKSVGVMLGKILLEAPYLYTCKSIDLFI
jgi:hypothetical protein